MGSEGRTSMLGPVLVGGAMLIIVAGAFATLLAGWWGLVIVGFGLLDLATVPFVLRAVGTRLGPDRPAEGEGAVEAAASAEAESTDPTHNPYARED